MKHRAPLVLLAFAPALTACFQELNPSAATNTNSTAPPADSGLVYASNGTCPPGMIVGGGDGLMGHGVCIAEDLSTPPIQLSEVDEGITTTDPCVKTVDRSLVIRQMYCGQCHSGTSASSTMAGFGAVLDDTALETAVSSLVMDPQKQFTIRLLIPGDPDGSRLYQFISQGVMPPRGTVYPTGSTEFSAPTVSDISTIRTWINCLGDAGAGGSYTPSTPAGDNSGVSDGGPG